MNAESLSVSSPIRGKGSLGRKPFMASTMSICSRTGRATHSVHPDVMSVKTRECTKLPYESGPAMHDQIDLQVAWSNFSPIPERANRNQLADAVNPRGLLLAAARRLFPHGPEQAIDRGGAHRQQLLLHTVV